MRSTQWTLVMVVAVLMGCMHHDPEVSVLSPLGESVGYGVLGDTAHFQYIGFSDDLTESVFDRLARSRVYQIAARGTHLLCPSNPSHGKHGYVLQTHVDKLMGDSALATMRWSCQRPYQSMEQTSVYMLRRRNGTWQIERAIGGAIGILVGAPRRHLTNVAADERSL
jgi:hypothetical protein